MVGVHAVQERQRPISIGRVPTFLALQPKWLIQDIMTVLAIGGGDKERLIVPLLGTPERDLPNFSRCESWMAADGLIGPKDRKSRSR